MDTVRIDFALIPKEPLFSAVIAASQAITDEFYYNTNVIDAERFPPHLSLLIASIPRDKVDDVSAAIEKLAKRGLPSINPTGVEPSSGGYVMLNVERTPEILAAHEAVLTIAAEARAAMGSDPYGSTYVRDAFTPHFSLAKIDRDDQAEAASIGRRAFGALENTGSQAFDLCDIGANSERWDTLFSVAGTAG